MSNVASSSGNQASRDEDDADSPSLTASDAHNRRREQVRRAQRSHRERRATYLKSLEAEVEILRAKDAIHIAEIEHFKTVNRRLCSILRENGLPVPLGLDKSSNENTDNTLQSVGATEPRQRLETFTSRASPAASASSIFGRSLLDLNDPQIAVDFVMDLEAPCLVQHPHFEGPDGETGHSMQLRNMILPNPHADNILSFTQQQPAASTRTISNTELRETLLRLLQAASSLNMPGEMTPVQCWNTLRLNPRASRLTKRKLDEIKQAFLAGVMCYGFGATMDEEFFRSSAARLLPES